jgi:hypothetical protein
MKRIYFACATSRLEVKRRRKRSSANPSLLYFLRLADIGLHDTYALLGDKPGHSRNVRSLGCAAVRGLHITSD